MWKNDYRWDVPDEMQSESSQILFWMAVLIGGWLLIFMVIWVMLRVNYKLREVRESFFPIIWWIWVALLIIALLYGLFVVVLNALSRKKYKPEEEFDED